MFLPKGQAGGVQFWDWRAGKRLGDPVPTPTEPRGLAYSPDGGLLAVTCADGWVVLIDPAAQRVVRRLDVGVRSRPWIPNFWIANGMARFSPDGLRLVTWEMAPAAQVWDVALGRKPSTLTHDHRIWDVTIDPSGRRVATAASDVAQVWDLTTGAPAGPALAHPQAVTVVRFRNEGKQLLAACGDGTITRWDWKTGRLLAADRLLTRPIHDLAITVDRRWLVAAAVGETGVFDQQSVRLVSPLLLSGLPGLSVCVTPGGDRAVVAGFGGVIYGLDLAALTTPAVGPVEDLRLTAQLLAGAQLSRSAEVFSQGARFVVSSR
jgi:WD40 repeat protein